jgi:hypothetical protein
MAGQHQALYKNVKGALQLVSGYKSINFGLSYTTCYALNLRNLSIVWRFLCLRNWDTAAAVRAVEDAMPTQITNVKTDMVFTGTLKIKKNSINPFQSSNRETSRIRADARGAFADVNRQRSLRQEYRSARCRYVRQ